MRFDWDKIIGKIRLRSRLEFVSDYLHQENLYENGALFSQLIKYQDDKLKCVFQLACFDTEILEYLYEYDVDGAMCSAVLSGNDIYYNLLLSVAFLKKIKVQSKISGWLQENDKMKISLQISTSL